MEQNSKAPVVSGVINQDYELVATESLKPHPRNVNHGDLVAIGDSIVQNGFYGAIVAQRSTGYILAGNHRHEAARAAGLATVPVVWVDVDDDRALRILLADNRTTRLGHDDQEALAALLSEILDGSGTLEGTGFDHAALDELLAELGAAEVVGSNDGLTDPDLVPQPPEHPVTVPGDVWVLGRHRLLCGDSTSINAVERLVGGTTADMVFTDPPYNVDYDPESRPNGPTSAARRQNPLGKIQNDNKDPQEFRKFLDAVYSCMNTVLKPGGSIYICHADTEGHHFRNAFVAQPWNMQSCLIWKKTVLVFGRADYHWMHEPILYGWKEGAGHGWEGDRKQTTIIEVATDHFNKGESDTGGKYVHPTQKPVQLIAMALGNSSKPGEVVLDLFGGSGSTMIAAEKTGRSAQLMELEPRFADVIVKRWQDFTGEQATLAGDGRTFDEIKSERFFAKHGAQNAVTKEIVAAAR